MVNLSKRDLTQRLYNALDRSQNVRATVREILKMYQDFDFDNDTYFGNVRGILESLERVLIDDDRYAFNSKVRAILNYYDR